MAINGLTNQQMEQLKKEYDRLQMDRWNTREDYDRALMRSMQDELQFYWKFQTWLKFTHPDVIQEYRAIQDIERKANDAR